MTALAVLLMGAGLGSAAWAADDKKAAKAAEKAADKPVAYDPTYREPFGTWGEGRLIGALPPDLQVNTDGDVVGQGFHLDSRLRAGAVAGPKQWRFSAELDLFEGQIAGDPWDLTDTPDARERDVIGFSDPDTGSFSAQRAVEVRRAAMNGRLGPVGLELGLVTSHWGLGMIANDGAHDPTFGRNDFGDRVLRARIATRPFNGGKLPLYVIGAFDRVVEDEIGQWTPFHGVEDDPTTAADEAALANGQAAYNGILSFLYNDLKQKQAAGLYGVYRTQTEADGERKTRVFVVDGYWDWTWKVGGDTLRTAIEAATINGFTDRAQTYSAREGVKIRAGSVTGLVGYQPAKAPLEGLLRFGWQSGDGDPDDGTVHELGWDRDFDVGMVMFDEVQGSIDAGIYRQLNNPEHSGGPPEGVEALVSEGGAKAVMFVQPVVQTQPIDLLQIKVGWLPGWSTRPIAHPFTTYRNGGNPANFQGTPTTGYWLGSEVDWAILVGDQAVTPAKLRPAFLVQGGHYFASADMGGETHHLLMGEARVRW